MTRTLYHRDSVFMRFMSAFVALAFTLSIAGSGFAAPPAVDSATTPESTPVAEAPAPVPDPGEVPAAPDPAPSAPEPAPSVEAPPTTTEPGTAGDPTGTSEPASTENVSVSKTTSSPEQPASVGKSSGKKTLDPAAVTAAASVVSALVTPPYASFQTVDWEAYRISPPAQVGWQKSNLGEYKEGDWVPVRIFVDNTSGAEDLRFPGFLVAFDYLNANANAIAVDGAQGFRYAPTSGGSLPSASPFPGGAQDISSLFSTSASGSSFNIRMDTPGTDLVVPAGEYGVVYFQVHLAITQFWQTQDPAHFGAKEYPGSSAQGRFIEWNGEGTGDNTISIPVGQAATPEGAINGVKFNDLDHDGVKDAGEPGLSGWEFTITYSGEFPFTASTTSGAGGVFSFTELPAGNYSLNETPQSPWVNSTPLPMSIVLARDEVKSVVVGNYVPDVVKTWSLSIDALPAGGTPLVKYSVNGGVLQSTTLTGSGPYTATINVPYGAVISNIGWYVNYGGSDVLLGTSPNETLTANKTNSFTYNSSITGQKFDSETLDGLSGWTIVLKRVVNSVETTYATTTTGAGGVYAFADVIPGTYKLYEIQQEGWLNTVAPIGSFEVINGSQIVDKNFGNLHMAPAINIVKTGVFGAGANNLADVGELITYTFTVTNAGNIPLHGVTVTDPKVSPITFVSGDTNSNGALDLIETWTYTGTYAVTQADINAGSVLNLATADSTESGPDTDDETVPLPQNPMLNIVKSGVFGAGANNLADPGELITYTFTVTNTGNVTLHGVTVTDPKVSPITFVSGDTNSNGALDLTETWTYTGTYAVTQADINAGSVFNIATADSTESGPDTDDETVPLPQNAALNIVKSGVFGAGANNLADVGELITYTFTVTNTGNVTLHGVTVTDPKVSPITFVSGDTNSNGALDLTETWTYTGTYAVTQVDIDAGSVLNLATADSTESGPDTDDETVPLPQGPAIQLLKSGAWVDGNADGNADVGESILYTFSVTNTGNVTLFDVTVTDPLVVVVGGPIAVLPGGATDSTTFIGSYAITQADIDAGSVFNMALATGEPLVGPPVTDTDDNTAPLPQNAALNIVKSGVFGAGANNLADVGELITYTFTVTNTGNVTLHGVTVTDPKVSPITFVSGDTNSNGALDLTETWTYTGTYAVTQVDIDAGSVLNLATADSTESGPDTDDETVPLPQGPAIQLLKSGAWVDGNADGNADVGESILYTFSVTNTGNVTLFNVQVTDPLVVVVGGPIAVLPVGATDSTTFIGSYAITQADIDAGFVFNMALATGIAPNEQSVNDTDDNTALLPQSAAIDIVKTANPTVVLAGQQVTYTFVVTNTGNVTLNNVAVTDNILGPIGNIGTLAVGASTTLTKVSNISVDTTNVATATGDYGVPESQFSGTVSDTDDAFVNVVAPAIDVVKTAAPTAILSGETVVYTYTVTNIGDVVLQNVTLTDDRLGAVGQLASLAVGESRVFTSSTQLSVPTTNVVTAVGADEFGHQVSATDDAFVDVAAPFTPPDLVIDKSADKTEASAGDTVTYKITYRNVSESPASDMTIVDDFDERYVTVTDANGGTVADGKITWKVAGPLFADDGPQTITYTVKIDDDLPSDVTVVRNTVVISEPTEVNTSDNSDTWAVDISAPFLPFTGGEWILILMAALMAAAVGVILRRIGRSVA